VRYSKISKELLLFSQLSHIRNLQFLIINFFIKKDSEASKEATTCFANELMTVQQSEN